MTFMNEKVFKSKKSIKYVFQSAKKDNDFLIVVFSGFGPKGSKPVYNYIRTLSHLDVNKLFILDDQGDRGCYYLGENRNFDIEFSVISLINHIANNQSIHDSNIICCGSSKGGYAALYFSIKYEFGFAIVGAPQTKLGSYLYKVKELSTLEFIAGDCSDESVLFCDKLLYDVVEKSKQIPDLYIHVGSGEHHYEDHVLPFQRHLNRFGFDCSLDLKDYSDHGKIGEFYQKVLLNKLIEKKIPVLKDSFRITDVNVEVLENKFLLSMQANKKATYAWYVLKDKKRVHMSWYTDNPDLEYKIESPGKYEFVAFCKDQEGMLMIENTNKYIIVEKYELKEIVNK